MNEIDNGDISLVELKNGKPNCRKHGAMNKVSVDGIWRCISTYGVKDLNTGNEKANYNLCRAACLIKN